jgi:phage terminase large subunit
MASSLALIGRVRALQRLRDQIRQDRRERKARKLAREQQAAEGPPLTTETVLYDLADDPQGFCERFLRVRSGPKIEAFRLWAKQGDLAKAVAVHRRVACRSGHKIGKSKLAAALAIWWACTRGNARVILTAPTERQVKAALWYEVRQFWANSPELRSIMPEPALAPQTGVRWSDGRELFGFTARDADAVSGPGGPEVLVIVDEASGVPKAVWEALQGVRAGGGKVLALGNPTQVSGWFFDAFHERRDGWDLHHISSLETPNCTIAPNTVPGLADLDFAKEIENDYGLDSPAYAVRVLGKFPENVANAVIGLGLIELARMRWDTEAAEADDSPLDLGVDVARMGDDFSAVAARRGLWLFSPAYFEKEHELKAVVNGYDTTKVTGLVLQVMAKLRRGKERVRIKIDATGGYGGAIADRLWEMINAGELDDRVEVIEINVSVSASDKTRWPRRRDEIWFNGREWCKAGGALYRDAMLESELMAPIYAPTVTGQNKVESKDETKKKLGRSPDRADAALLAIYEPPVERRKDSDDVAHVASRWDGFDDDRSWGAGYNSDVWRGDQQWLSKKRRSASGARAARMLRQSSPRRANASSRVGHRPHFERLRSRLMRATSAPPHRSAIGCSVTTEFAAFSAHAFKRYSVSSLSS